MQRVRLINFLLFNIFMKKVQSRTPSSMAGILTFSDTKTGGPSLNPKLVLGVVVAFIIVVIILRMATQ